MLYVGRMSSLGELRNFGLKLASQFFLALS